MKELVQNGSKPYRAINGIRISDHDETDAFQGIDNSLPKSAKKNGLMLDLAPASGRWLIEASRKKYIPVGVSKSIDEAGSALRNMRKQHVNGYVVVSGKYELPFQADLFDLIWSHGQCSFSHAEELTSFVSIGHKVLAKSGRIKIAVSSDRDRIAKDESLESDLSLDKIEKIFHEHFSNVSTYIQTCFGTTPTKTKWKRSSLAEKPRVALAMAVSYLSKFFSSLNVFANSCFISSQKIKGPQNIRIAHFLRHHWLKENLNIVYLLQCPISGGPVYLSKDSKFVISDKAGVKYPVIEEIPIMLRRAAIPMERKSASEVEMKSNSA